MPRKPLNVLIVTDSEEYADVLVQALHRGGFELQHEQVHAPGEMKGALARQAWDVVIADYGMPRFSALDALTILRLRSADLPFILVSDATEESLAVAALKVGADDYILKDNLTRLAPAVDRALRDAQARRVRQRAERALRESEERYRELVENANDIVFTIDLQGTFTAINRAGEQISGYTRDEIVQMNMRDVLAPASIPVATEMIRRKLEGQGSTVYELEIMSRDGGLVPLEVSTRLIMHDGKPSGVQGIARDITQQRLAAQALRESEERYRGLFESANDLVYVHDLEGRFLAINKAAEQLTEYTREEVLRLNIAHVVAPEHLDLVRDMIRHKLVERASTTYEIDVLTKGGRRVTVEINSQLIYQNGEPIAVQGIARDVTDRRRAERELQARERKQAAVAQLGQRALASTDLVTLFDDATEFLAVTLCVQFSAILELAPDGESLQGIAGYGWRDGVAVGTTVPSGPGSQAGYALHAGEPVLMEDLRNETRFTIPPILHDHDVRSGISVIIHGTSRPFGVLSAFSVEPAAFTQGDIHFLQAVANVLAAAIERTHMEEERTRHSMELATRVLQAQEEERKRIARELHDETAQSLSTLLINLDLVASHIPPDAEALRAGVERVGALARRTLDETRALSHDLRPTILDDVGFVAALQWFAAECESDYGASVTVDADTAPPEPLSPEMELALFRITQEALTNSGKHSGATHVTVTLTYDDRTARLEIEDNGGGFDPSQVSGPTREGRLGMYGMQERAVLLGGTLAVSTAPQQGTRIVVEVPLPRPSETLTPVALPVGRV